MDKLSPWAFGTAAAIAFSFVYFACAVAFALVPEPTFQFFDALFHSIDLAAIRPASPKVFAPGQFVYGLVGVAVTSFLAGAVLACTYNLIRRWS
jgi:hypothetical protein